MLILTSVGQAQAHGKKTLNFVLLNIQQKHSKLLWRVLKVRYPVNKKWFGEQTGRFLNRLFQMLLALGKSTYCS